jgi:hypothetical protein
MKEDRLEYRDLDLPNYVNTRQVYAGLDVSDLAKVAVLSGLNLMLVGDTGTGKSQLASDIYRTYFGGNKSEGGNGVFVRAHPDMDLYSEIFTELNIEKAKREMTDSLDSLVFFVDELNRAPPISQNQFFGLGDGKMDYKGSEIQIGKEGYHLLISTANIGNGEFTGTFETDKALLNRLHIALDLEYGAFKPTYEDVQGIRTREANPNVVTGEVKDISGRILRVNQEINELTTGQDLETMAVLNYLGFGLNNCQRFPINGKDRVWPMACQDCDYNQDGEALCSKISSPTTRTLEVVRKFNVALKYLAKMKNPKIEIKPHESVFKAFEFSGAYQHLLNPTSLRENFNHNPKLMAEVVQRLKEDYESNRDYLMTSIKMTEKGDNVTRFFTQGNQFGLYDNLSDKARERTSLVEPYTDKRAVGLNWVNNFLDYVINDRKSKK